MHCDSLEEYGVPLFAYKTYYEDNGRIYLALLSDLLRTAHIRDYNTRCYIYYKARFYQYEKKLKKYMKESDETLDEKIMSITQDKALNERYFIKGTCKRKKWYRKVARSYINYITVDGILRSMIYGIITLFLFAFFLTALAVVIASPIKYALFKLGFLGKCVHLESITVYLVSLFYVLLQLIRADLRGRRRTKFEKKLMPYEDA